MKKVYLSQLTITVLICLSTIFSERIYAQVSGYAFAQAAGAPTAISGTYTQHTSGTTDYGVYTSIPMGFTFSFNCVNYTTVSISNDGYIVMGNSLSNTYTPLSTGTNNNVIAALAADMQGTATGTLRSQTSGSAPNRTFTVEWWNYRRYAGTDVFNFQIILTETTNTIRCVYSNSATTAPNSYQVGIRGGSSADFNIRTKAQADNWIGSAAAALNTDVMIVGANASRSPNGQFTWTPAASCSGAPLGGLAGASPASVCSGSPTTLSLTGATVGCGITYQWQSAPLVGGPWTNIGGATSSTYVASPAVATFYRCVITCTNGGATANSSPVQVTMSPPTNCYCTSIPSTTADEEIFSVTVNGGTNAYNCSTVAPGPGSILNRYSNFMTLPPLTSIMQGQTVAFSISEDECDGATYYNNGCAIWIDFNQNGSFADVGEQVYVEGTTTVGPRTISGNITVPIGATVGNTGMRIIVAEGMSGASLTPCMTYSYGETEDYTITITATANCSGTPSGGLATANPTSICVPASSTLSVNGYPLATGITFQWQSAPVVGGPWTNIGGATSSSYIAAPIVNTFYRCVVGCTFSGLSANSDTTMVNILGPTYATVPYVQDFETWVSRCNTRELPSVNWAAFPLTGNNSWRRDDQGVDAAWTAPASYIYAPVFTVGAHSARFHSGNVCPSGGQGYIDLYINLSAPGTKSICFDYINTSGTDALTVLLSTNGGSTFPTTLLTLGTAAAWTTQTVTTASTSSTAVIRFMATGDCGSTDIGIDNLSVALPGPPNCAIYNSPANGTSGIVCGINAIMNWTSNGPSCFPPTSYDVYFGANVNPPFVVNQTGTMYNPGTLTPSTTYYWKIVPRNSTGPAAGCAIYSFTTGATYGPSQTTPPITDGFENCLDWTVVNGAQPNKWLRGTATFYAGTYSMYINNTASNNNYNISASSVVHFYKDITFATGNDYTLKFYWKGMGESASYDYLRVYFAPTTVTPVEGVQVNGTYALTPFVYNQSAIWEYESATLPTCGGETKRLIFSWYNDGSGGTQPPIAIDDIQVTSTPVTGTTCSNPVVAILPFARTGESTLCMIDNYTNASISSCGTSYESGNDKVYRISTGLAGCMSVTLSNASNNNIGFQVYNGCPDAPGTSCIANFGGATGGSLTGDVSIPAVGTYYLIVDTWAAPTSVTYDINISSVGSGAVNDLPCNATPLALGISASSDNSCTSGAGEPAVPACWSSGAVNTVWFSVVVPASRDLIIRTSAISLMNTQIAVYTTSNCANPAQFTEQGCNNDAPLCATVTYYQSELTLTNVASAGTVLYIRVDGYMDLKGTFSIIAIDGNNGVPVWPPIPGQDCMQTNPVCAQTMNVGNPGYFAWGNICDFPSSSTCLASGEKSSVWYTININGNGNMEFDIVPNDYGNPNPLTGQVNPGYSTSGDESDYDWAIWRYEPTCDGNGNGMVCCTEIAAGAAAVRCDYSSLGVTGLYGNADYVTNPAYPGFASAYRQKLPVSNGEVYYLVISNFANDYVSGYTIQFSGTSPVSYTTASNPVIWAGQASTAWSQPGNWNVACSAPTCGINAVINSGGAQPVISANASVNSITINAGASLTILPACTLTVCGNFVNNGTLLLSPTSTLLFNNANVVQNISGSLTGTNRIGNLVIDKTGGSLVLGSAIDIGSNFNTVTANSVFNASSNYVKIGGNFNTASNVTLTNCPTVEFNGTGPQTFSNTAGTHTLTNVVMNNISGGGLTLIGGATSNMVLAGTLTLTIGVIYTAATPILIMNAGSIATSGNAASFVDGPMRKIGNTAFVFPVGDAFNRWARIGISGLSAASTFEAQYFYVPYSNTTTMAVTPLPVLNNVSVIEYWMLNRIAGGNATATLYWEDAASSGINSCAALQGGDLVVGRWNGSAWENRSNTIVGGITGSCVGSGAGTVSSDVLTAFSPFTFSSKSALVNPLPVELLSFSGRNVGSENLLEWSTASEINNDYFILERANDAMNFEELAIIDGAGNSNNTLYYSQLDHYPYVPITYYRLKQIDFDGQYLYSHVISIETGSGSDQPEFINLYPNPSANIISLELYSPVDCDIVVQITDMLGRPVISRNAMIVKGNDKLLFDISNLAVGVYFAKVTFVASGISSNKRFIKQ